MEYQYILNLFFTSTHWKISSIGAFLHNSFAGRMWPAGCSLETLVLDHQLTDAGDIVSLTRQPPFTPRKIPGTHFCWRLSQPQGHSLPGRIRSIEKSNGLIGNLTCDLPSCSIVPQPTTLPRAPLLQVE
jgi:hypothetical protein